MGAGVINNYLSASKVETPTATASTVETNFPHSADNELHASTDRRDCTVVVGEGCIDLIF